MMRMKGKPLGTLDFETDVICLMVSTEPETDKEFLEEIKKGKFID